MNNLPIAGETRSAQAEERSERRKKPLRNCVQVSLENYFRDIGGHQPEDLYRMVIDEVEQAMLESVMRYANSNQTRAAEILGINRSTLRKKLKHYRLD